MEELKAAHYGLVSIEMIKNNRRYQLLVPLGVSWEEAGQTCDDFKEALEKMKSIAAEQAEKLKEEKEKGE